jgi:superfamily II DNA or RNA helicase
MAGLRDLTLRPSYRKGEQNIGDEFYAPCMVRATSYDRAVGFFASTIYSIVWPAMKEFVSKGGLIRIICSPLISENDGDALIKGYSDKQYGEYADKLSKELAILLEDPELNKPTKALALLVSSGVLDIKLAFVLHQSGITYNQIFHDKVGIFADRSGDFIVFKGSMNETWSGLSPDGNLESIDVFPSWIHGRDAVRAKDNRTFFISLWNDNYTGVQVKNFPDAARENLIRITKGENLDKLFDEINIAIESSGTRTVSNKSKNKLEPLQHQIDAIEIWVRAGYRGILEHATGSGKTLTAILAIRKHFERAGVALVLVPSTILLSQWERELKKEIPEAPLLKAGASNYSWMKSDRLRRFSAEDQNLGPRIILATMQTARTEEFLQRIWTGCHLMVVADEVHQIGSPENQKILSISAGSRLGLSATPVRYLDNEGTDKLLDYFGPVMQPVFTLKDSIKCGRLVEYEYYPHAIDLTTEESSEYRRLTHNIGVEISRLKKKEDKTIVLTERIKRLLIIRAKIIKKAKAKIGASIKILEQYFELGQRWLIYCEDSQQLKELVTHIRELEIDVSEYHTAMDGGQEESLDWFKTFGGVIVSIRCLDEGVDIPSITHALILASSKNPRQFIQRRGRILRRAPGKESAVIHDLLVLPPKTVSEPDPTAALRSELARALEFAKTARNQGALMKLRGMIIEAGFDPEEQIEYGFEEGAVK